jgi:hypothetical protein
MSMDTSETTDDQVDRAILAALRQRAVVGESADADADARLISAIVANHLAQRERQNVTRLVVGGVLAAAAAAALWLGPDLIRESPIVQADTSGSHQSSWVLERDGSSLQGIIVTSGVQTCGIRDGARVCLDPESRAEFELDGNLKLHHGVAQVEAESRLVLALPGARVHASTEAAKFDATSQDVAWTVSVESGTVTVTALGTSRVLVAGESIGSEPTVTTSVLSVDLPTNREPNAASAVPKIPSTPKPTPSADSLLTKARSERAARDFAAAARTYELLLRTYPNAAKVRASHVSLAQLYQGPLDDPAKALHHFDEYLEHGGLLAEEAHYGKIRALRSLGRSAAAEAEREAFLVRYPDSAHADALRGPE